MLVTLVDKGNGDEARLSKAKSGYRPYVCNFFDKNGKKIPDKVGGSKNYLDLESAVKTLKKEGFVEKK